MGRLRDTRLMLHCITLAEHRQPWPSSWNGLFPRVETQHWKAGRKSQKLSVLKLVLLLMTRPAYVARVAGEAAKDPETLQEVNCQLSLSPTTSLCFFNVDAGGLRAGCEMTTC